MLILQIYTTILVKFPETLETIILKRVKKLLGKNVNAGFTSSDFKKLANKVKELSDYFTKLQCDRPEFYLMDKSLLAAYVAYFLPSNLLKISKPLNELFCHPLIDLAKYRKVEILDLGSGPGTATIGLINYLYREVKNLKEEFYLKITLTDHVAKSLQEAETLIRDFLKHIFEPVAPLIKVEIETVVTDIYLFVAKKKNRRKYDFIIMSNSLGELDNKEGKLIQKVDLIKSLSRDYIKDDGSLIVIEPALKTNSRMLLMLRDEIILAGDLNVYSPCTTSGTCGALEKKRDWCHEAYEWDQPMIVNEIDKRTGFDKSRLKFSYLVLRKDGLTINDLFTKNQSKYFRVTSDLIINKGEKRVYLCGENGRVEVMKLDKEKSESNRYFDEIKRGDFLEVDGIYKKGALFRIGMETVVKPVALI